MPLVLSWDQNLQNFTEEGKRQKSCLLYRGWLGSRRASNFPGYQSGRATTWIEYEVPGMPLICNEKGK